MIYIQEKWLNDYEKQNNCVSFRNVLRGLNIYDNLLLCNNIVNVEEYLFDDVVAGDFDYEDDVEIYQYYLFNCSDYDLERIKEDTDLLVFYSEKLDLYVLGVTHFGTSWDYVFCDCKYKIV